MRTLARSLTLLLAAAALGTAQERFDPFALERLLPAGPLLYLSVPQSPAASEDYATSAVRKFWENDEIRAFKAPLEAWWAKRKTQAVPDPAGGPPSPSFNDVVKGATGLTIDDLWDLARGPFTAAIYDLPLGGQHGLDVVVGLGAPDVGLLRRRIGQAKDVLLKQGGGLKEGTYAHEGVTLHELGDEGFQLFYGFLEGHLVVATSKPRLASIVTASVKKQGPGLRDDGDFKAARAKVAPDGRHLFHLHVNTARTLKQYRAEIGDDAFKILEPLGLADVASLDLATAYDGGFLRERYVLRTSRQDRGLLKYLAGKPGPDAAAAQVPAGAVAYAHAAIDLGALYDAVKEASKADPDFEEGFAEGVKELEETLGVPLRDALASLGTDWSAWTVYPEGGGLFPYELAAMELRDPEVFTKALRGLAEALETPIERLTFRGRTIEHLTIGLPGAEELDELLGLGMGYPLAWTIDGRRLYLSTNPLALKRFLAEGAKPAKPIAADPRYAALAARVPADQKEAWVYVDLGRVFAAVYTMVEPALHVMRDLPRDPQTGELIVDLARLPMGETLSELIGPTFTHKRTTPDGLVLESWSNLGTSYTGLVGTLVAVGATAGFVIQRQFAAAAPAGPAANELIAQLSLQLLRQAEETLRTSDSDRNGAADYWTRDVAGLYALKDAAGQPIFLIDPQMAAADPDGAPRYGLTPAPKNGYFFKMMSGDPDGQAYQADEDKDGSAFTNKARFGVVAWPAQHGEGGRFTFIVSETGKIWKKDTDGRPVGRWPGKDPAQDGWESTD
jgi:hypothetical protein